MNHLFSWRFWKFFALLLLFAFVSTACRGNSTSGSTATPAAQSSTITQPTAATNTDPTTAPAGDTTTTIIKLNLNTASGSDFQAAIPGLGSNMVREFQEYRPYVSITQFRREIGKYVNDQQVAEYEKYVYVPVNPNDSDAETLKQLPGVDDTIAAALIAARPYNSNDDFLAKIAAYISAEDLALATAYLVTQ